MSETNVALCGGCLAAISDSKNVLICSSCEKSYHVTCIFPGQEQIPDPGSYDSSWLCPMCKPKTCTADGTPARTGNAGNRKNEDTNVTRRKKGALADTPVQDDVILTSVTVREIVKSEIKDLLKHLNDTMANFVNRELKLIKDEIMSVRESMSFMNDKYEEMRTEVQAKTSMVDLLQKENEQLKATVKDLNARVTVMEQQARSCNVEIQCLPEYKSENLVSTVVNMGRVLSCNIVESNIHNVTRIAKQNPANKRPKAIVVQFNSPRTRDEFLAAAIKYNKNNPDDRLNTAALGIGGAKENVYIVEHLSAYYKALHAAARTKAKALSYKYVWVRNGRIFMRKSDGSDYYYIKDYDALAKLE